LSQVLQAHSPAPFSDGRKQHGSGKRYDSGNFMQVPQKFSNLQGF